MLRYIIILELCCLCLFGCGEYKLEEAEKEENQEESSSTDFTLQLNISNENHSEVQYPLSVFLFDSKQQNILQKTIESDKEQFSTTLSKGIYRACIFSNLTTNHCTFPTEDLISTGSIKLAEESLFCTHPIQIGQASISLRKSTQVEVKLSYAVAAINFSLSGIPIESKNVEVSLSPVSSGISFSGIYDNDEQTCTLPCQKNGTRWTTETIYVLPCESSSTHISVKYQLPSLEDKAYSYTYNAPLKPGYPYQFNGNIDEGIALNGDFQIEGWQPEIDLEFGLEEVLPDEGDKEEGGGENGNEGNDNEDGEEDEEIEGNENELDTFIVPQLPTEDSIWGYFYVWKLQLLSEHKAKAIILAPDQSYGLRDENIPILQHYEVDGIKNWRVFSKEEAAQFRDQFRGEMGDLNYFFEQNGLDIFYYSEGGRYLCNDCQSTFSFTSNRITDAGKTVKYYLRPVKTVLLKVK